MHVKFSAVQGAIIDKIGGRYSIDQCKTMVMVAQQLADWAADQGEIERTSLYASVVRDLIAAAREAEMWARASAPAWMRWADGAKREVLDASMMTPVWKDKRTP